MAGSSWGLSWWLALLAVALAILSSRPLIAYLQGTLAVSEPLLPEAQQHDAVIVLGYALFRNGSLTEPLKGRVVHGVRAWEKGQGSYLIFSGAHPGGGLRTRSEADAMVSYAMEVHGVTDKPDTWLLESASTSTRTNALFSLDIMKAKGWTKALVVTNTFHQARSLWTFKRAATDLDVELEVDMARLPFIGHQGWGGGPLLNTAMDHVDYWRELAAIAWYKYRGWLQG